MVIACVDEGSNLTLNTVQLVSTSFSLAASTSAICAFASSVTRWMVLVREA